MSNFDKFLELCSNGPVEVGLAAGRDLITDADDKLYLSDNPELTLGGIKMPEGTEDKLKRAVYALALMAAHSGFASYRDNSSCVHDKAAVQAMGVPELTESDMQTAIMLLYATKINWWQTNHHTGTSNTHASGFTAKAMGVLQISHSNPDNVKAIWMAAHWFDTAHILSVIGVKGLPAAPRCTNGAKWPTPTEDIMKRALSNPAGTAQWFDGYTVMEGLVHSRYKRIVPGPVLEQHLSLKAALRSIKDSDELPRYHMGATYLTGRERKRLVDLSDEYKGLAKAALNVIFAKSSMAQSSAMRQFVSDEGWETALNGMRRATAKWAENMAQAIEQEAVAAEADMDNVSAEAFITPE